MRRTSCCSFKTQSLAIVCFVGIGMFWLGAAQASLELYQRNSSIGGNFIGRGGVSSDGLGQLAPGGTLQVEIPDGSTVQFALLYAATVFGGDTTSLIFNGQTISLTSLPNVENPGLFSTTRADVTEIVRDFVGSGGGTFNFTVDSDPIFPLLNGVALVVVYANKSLPERSILILDGGLGFDPQTTTVAFRRPVNKSKPGFQATLALGIQHGYQGGGSTDPGTHACGDVVAQYNIVDINSQRLTSCAGNYDDGFAQNGALVTVGGVGDSLDIPADPFQTAGDGTLPRTSDDELYKITGFVNDGDTSLTLTTSNPSRDDSIFLAILTFTGEVTVIPPVTRKFVIFVQGLGTELDTSIIARGFETTFDDLKTLLRSETYGYSVLDFLEFSYRGGAVTADGDWWPNSYGCGDTAQDLIISAEYLAGMIADLQAVHANAKFSLVGHSLGGLVAFTVLEWVAAGILPSGVIESIRSEEHTSELQS